MSASDLDDDSEGTTVAEPVETDANVESDPTVETDATVEHEEPPRGTMVIVGLFLALMIFMFGWAYVILIVQG